MIDYFPKRVIVKAKQHAVKCFPEESCGLVINDDYIPCENIAENKLNDFRIDTKLFIVNNENIEAVIHSHNNHPHASKKDMEQQILTNVPWGIVNVVNKIPTGIWFWGDQLPTQDLIGRPFAHGIYDCYALCRSYYKEKLKINLPQFPRDEGFWRHDNHMIMDNFEQTGFVVIDRTELKAGDCLIGSVLSSIVNHTGVYIGNGLFLHHLYNRLSRTDPLVRWNKYIVHCLRYEGV